MKHLATSWTWILRLLHACRVRIVEQEKNSPTEIFLQHLDAYYFFCLEEKNDPLTEILTLWSIITTKILRIGSTGTFIFLGILANIQRYGTKKI